MHHWVTKGNQDKKEHFDYKVIECGLPDQPVGIRMKNYEDKEVVLQDIMITPLDRLPIRAFAENVVFANRDLSIGITKLKALYQSVLNEVYYYEPSSVRADLLFAVSRHFIPKVVFVGSVADCV